MREVLPGVFHWPAIHPNIHSEVSSASLALRSWPTAWCWEGHTARMEARFVPDSLMDDPSATTQALLDACSTLLAEVDFDHLPLAHGGPMIGDARAQLQDLVDCGGRTAFEM